MHSSLMDEKAQGLVQLIHFLPLPTHLPTHVWQQDIDELIKEGSGLLASFGGGGGGGGAAAPAAGGADAGGEKKEEKVSR